MSDLTATGCGCGNNTSLFNNGSGCSSIIWIILLLSLCGGCGNGTSLLNNDNGGCGCDILIILLLLSCFSSNNNSCGC